MTASTVAERILQYLEKNELADSLSLVKILNEDSQKIVGAIKSLDSLGDVITVEQFSVKQWEVTNEGKEVAGKGSHEALVYNAVPEAGISQPELMKIVPNAKVGFSKAMSAGWIVLDKSSGQPIVKRKVDTIQDIVQQKLSEVLAGKNDSLTEEQRQEYKKRKLVQEVTVKGFTLKKGPAFSLSVNKPETDLTPEMIAQGTWRNKQFKEYNLGALGVPPVCGHLHPLLKVRAEFRQIFLEMGFSEMPTNNYVESSFWNFDALFQPQQHPARDAHDTFFLSEPKVSSNFPMEYLERVKKVHSNGGYGSQGYGYDWKIEEAEKNLLRTHTTAVSARMLYALSQKGFKPVKYFSIDKVFRNETLDATHLAEFHQVEGVVADYNLSLGDLIGTLYEFFQKLGIGKLYFKPAYNPYTEPSMEIFSYHEGLKKWMEVGNSGVFRPEMLLPMGLPENVNVIAWGLSLERPTMIKYGIDNIRDLVGPKVDLQMVQDCPICRLDKDENETCEEKQASVEILDKKWDDLLDNLGKLKQQIEKVKFSYNISSTSSILCEDIKFQDMTIISDPKCPPYAVLAMLKIFKDFVNFNIVSYKHSTVKKLSKETNNFIALFNSPCSTPKFNVNFIWQSVGTKLELILSPVSSSKILGEVNAVRFFSRLISNYCKIDWFENISADHSSQVDFWLDKAHSTFISGSKNDVSSLLQSMESKLQSSAYLTGEKIAACDFYVFSVLVNLNLSKTFPTKVTKWYENCKSNKYIN